MQTKGAEHRNITTSKNISVLCTLMRCLMMLFL